jgi:hypothetical protein
MAPASCCRRDGIAGRRGPAGRRDIKDAFSLFEHFNPGQTKLLDEGIARGEGHLDVAAGVRVPTA